MFVARIVLGSAVQFRTVLLYAGARADTWSRAHTYTCRLQTLHANHIRSYSTPVVQLVFTNPALNRAYQETVPVLQRSLKYKCRVGWNGESHTTVQAPPNLTVWSWQKKNICSNQWLFCVLLILLFYKLLSKTAVNWEASSLLPQQQYFFYWGKTE